MSFTAFGELTPVQKVNWSRVVWKAARDQMFLKNFMSDTGNSVVHRITELTATEKGTQCLFQLVADLVGDGVRGDDEREEASAPCHGRGEHTREFGTSREA